MSELLFDSHRIPLGASRASPYPPANDEQYEYPSEHTHTPRSEVKEETEWTDTEEPIDQHDFAPSREGESESPGSVHDELSLPSSEKNENDGAIEVSK
ncbi:hypothetical protein H0H92_013459 [Tricholoma furcatifolium]|nr:hypothetical protein H0H92_013459 [Tricholoma furcatifolium]